MLSSFASSLAAAPSSLARSFATCLASCPPEGPWLPSPPPLPPPPPARAPSAPAPWPRPPTACPATLTQLAGSFTGAFADLPDRFVRSFADFADRFARSFGDRFQRVRDLLQDVRVTVERGQDPVDDRRDMVEPRPQQGLGFDAVDVEFDLPQLGMDADAEPDQVQHLGVERDPGHEVVELEMDLVDLDHRDVNDDVRFVGIADFARVDDGVVLIHALRHGLAGTLVPSLPVRASFLLRGRAFVAAPAAFALTLLRHRLPLFDRFDSSSQGETSRWMGGQTPAGRHLA
jgi:hypothetical protein